jgi:hypothetical protein
MAEELAMVHARGGVPKGKIALPSLGPRQDAWPMPGTDGPSDAVSLPGAGVLLACAVLLIAGYGAAWWHGVAPSVEVRVVPVPAPVAEAPTGS